MMKIPFRMWSVFLVLGLLMLGFGAYNLKLRYEDYKLSRIDLGYVIDTGAESDNQGCTRIAVYKGDELAGENPVCGGNMPVFQVGEMVKVIWKQDQPKTAKIYTFDLYWSDDLTQLAFGMNALLAAMLLGWGASKNKIPEELLGPKANTVNLTVFGVQASKSLVPSLINATAVYARYDPMDDAFSLFPQSGKNVQSKDQLRIFRFVIPSKSKDGIPRPLPSKGTIIRAKLDLSNPHSLAYWPDYECVSRS